MKTSTLPASVVRANLRTMTEMQIVHNDEVHPRWHEQGYDYHRAIWVECAELMDHYGWKWWKKQESSPEQVKLEIVDIWHFGLSILIRDGTPIDETTAQIADYRWPDGRAEFRQAVEALALASLRHEFSVDRLLDVMSALPMSWTELFEGYVSKNILNRFRQANGYKSGHYRKTWWGREDNEHLTEIMQDLNSADVDLLQKLWDELGRRYAASADS